MPYSDPKNQAKYQDAHWEEHLATSRRWYKRHKAQHFVAVKRWKDQNKEFWLGYRRHWRRTNGRRILLAEYGMTQAQYDALLKKQKGLCAICRNPPDREFLCVDHDHKTGKVRGLLCSPCNARLGHLEDRLWIKKAFAYMDRTK